MGHARAVVGVRLVVKCFNGTWISDIIQKQTSLKSTLSGQYRQRSDDLRHRCRQTKNGMSVIIVSQVN